MLESMYLDDPTDPTPLIEDSLDEEDRNLSRLNNL